MARRLERCAVAVAVVAALASCTLLTSVDGLTGGGSLSDASPQGDATPPGDASVDSAAPPVDAANDRIFQDTGAGDALEGGPCSAQSAVLGGNVSTLFTALRVGNGTWTVASVSHETAGHPSLVRAPGGGFHGVFQGPSSHLSYVTSAGGATWSAPMPLGSNDTTAPTALFNDNGVLRLLFRSTDSALHQAVFAADAGWQAAATASASLEYGVGAAPVSSTIVAVYTSHIDQTVHDIVFAGGTWQAPQLHAGAGTLGTMRVAALAGGPNGSPDLLSVYRSDPGSGQRLTWIARSSGSGQWSAPASVADVAVLADLPDLLPLSNGRALAALRAADGHPMSAIYDPIVGWSGFQAIVANPVDGVVTLAAGVCGDEAVAAWPSQSDNARVAHFRQGTWLNVESIPGVAAATFLRVATSP